jgi:Ca2+:H+ antiporter
MINILLLFVPASMLADYVFHAPPVWVFLTGILAIIPLAEWVRRATEHLADTLGSAIGGLLNVSFGNAPELILALFILKAGHQDIVKAQITGSIIGNSLLGLGLAVVAGTAGRRAEQKFDRERAGLLSSLLVLSVIALMIPALFDYTERALATAEVTSQLDEKLSLGVAVVLILVYAANLVYTLITHKDVFSGEEDGAVATPADASAAAAAAKGDAHHGLPWSLGKSIAILCIASAITAVEAEIVSGAVEATADTLGLTTFFLGITVLAVVGNAAEYISAVYFARQDRMGLVMSITVGSTIQIALMLAPLLVIVSYLMGKPMNLVFGSPLELIAIAGVAFAVEAITKDGKTTWFEGILLLAVYALLCLAFFFVR